MPCPHHDIKIVQRSNRQSAVAAAAYQSGERLFSEYDQKQKYYSEKRGIVHTEIMLPPHAPPEYADRNTLWNAAEAIEKQWNSQLARRIVLAIPREIPRSQHADLIRDYCREFFVSKGMIADFAIHDKGDGNPHAHILLTMRAMDENGKWLPKSRKVYDLDENGERILFTPDTEKWETQQTGTVTTCGGNLNVRTGAGLDNDAFTQLPDGAQVEVIGTEGEWVKVLLPEREGYVHSDYLTITDTGSFSLSLDGTDLSALLELFASGLSGGGGAALTPDGNLSLIDDLGGTSSGKQFITVETKGGNVFYLIIDRDDEGAQTVHFLNQVDEADLLALMEDGEAQEAPAVCTCTEKCQAGAVNTSCEVCAVNMAECAGAEPEPEPEPEPEAEKSGGMGALALVLALVVLGGGGAFAYIKFIRPKQASKVSADPDDYDFADEEEYINEDEPEPEEEMEDTK